MLFLLLCSHLNIISSHAIPSSPKCSFCAFRCMYMKSAYTLYADSCENLVIEDSYISVGDDGIAIKSGWDQYGIAYGQPSTNIIIRNVTVRSTVR